MQKNTKDFQHSVSGSYHTALSYHVHHGIFVLFTFVRVEVIWLDTVASDQSLALLHVLRIN